MDVYTKKCKELATQIEHKRGKEREIQESIEEESKNMEKMANKRAVKLRKVRLSLRSLCFVRIIYRGRGFLNLKSLKPWLVTLSNFHIHHRKKTS